MVSILKEFGIGGGILFAVVVMVFLAEFIKTWSTIWGTLAPRYFGIKTKISEKKKLDELVVQNKVDLDTYISTQEEFNKDIKNSISEMRDIIEDTSDVVVSIQVESMRSKILSFASTVANGGIATKEQYNYIRKVYKNYEEVIQKRGLENEEVEYSYQIIESAFHDNIKNHTFLDDRLQDPEFQKKIKEKLS